MKILALRLLILASVSVGFIPLTSKGGSAVWKSSPGSGNWLSAGNWSPRTVPNGPADVATFDTSTITDISISRLIQLDSLVFDAGASPFTITQNPGSTVNIGGNGIINNSGVTQNFLIQAGSSNQSFADLKFIGSASAGDQVSFVAQGALLSNGLGSGEIDFFDNASAGNATFLCTPGMNTGGSVQFDDTATAGNGTFMIQGATDTLFAATYVSFIHSSSAGSGHFFVQGASEPARGGGSWSLGGEFHDMGPTTADHATVVLDGGAGENAAGATAFVRGPATLADAVLTVNGTDFAGAVGGNLTVLENAFAGNATIIVNGGAAAGGDCGLGNGSDGGTSRLEVFGNGTITTQCRQVGSIEGDGIFGAFLFKDGVPLQVGTNNLSTVFSGPLFGNNAIQKVGSGHWTLSGANDYTGGTSIEQGWLVVNNTTGSGTGTGDVTVDKGTLGGKGTIAGNVTVGASTKKGAFLAPSIGVGGPTTLTIGGHVTFGANATYTCKLNAKAAQADDVVAAGVQIIAAAKIKLSLSSGTLSSGTVFTVITNSGGDPIDGTYANLSDGGTIVVGDRTFLANYEGGDGNDLTLTVLP